MHLVKMYPYTQMLLTVNLEFKKGSAKLFKLQLLFGMCKKAQIKKK